MQVLIFIGALVSLLGLGGLIWCIIYAARAKRQGLSEAEMNARLQRAVAMNMGALCFSVIGLMMVVIGIFLG